MNKQHASLCFSKSWLIILALIFGMMPAFTIVTGTAQAGASAGDVTTLRKFNIDEPVVALTFDAGADRGYAEGILNTLRDEGVRASFGMTGVWAERNPDLVRRMADEGHHLMNHSWDHPSFVEISTTERINQLRRTDALIQELTGRTLRPYFRPPYGSYNEDVLRDIGNEGYIFNVMWTVDSLGWKGYSAAQIFDRVMNAAEPGAIVLMHVGAQSQDAVALDNIIRASKARGYSFQSIEELAEGARTEPPGYFPETGYQVNSDFMGYWRARGGLEIFGYPISERRLENGIPVQYFERARFEWHAEYEGTPSEVLLGLLGTDVTRDRRAAGEPPFVPVSAATDANCTFFEATGHRLCFGFRSYWQRSGGLAVFGYPISEEFRERNPDDGQIYTVQYFERARFEWHPENAGTPHEVLLGRLGAQVLNK